jgi:hypothetical protein
MYEALNEPSISVQETICWSGDCQFNLFHIARISQMYTVY